MIPILGRLGRLNLLDDHIILILVALGVSTLPMFSCFFFGRWKEFRKFSLCRMLVLVVLATVFSAGTKVLSEHFDVTLREMYSDADLVTVPWWAGVLLPAAWALNVHILHLFVRYEPEYNWPKWRRALDATVAWGIATTISTFCLGFSLGFIYLSQLSIPPEK
ncbi:MAG: hypothetical protein KIS92_23220 [Planctomycetota bacterium]|nr:hypothetical protein [Planctomycetota bacterium]